MDFPMEGRTGHIVYDVRPWHDVAGEVGGLVTYIGSRPGAIVPREEPRSENRYQLLADNVRDVIWTMDISGRFTYVSPSILDLRGFTPDKVRAQSIEQALAPESAKNVQRFIAEGLEVLKSTGRFPEQTREVERLKKGGEWFRPRIQRTAATRIVQEVRREAGYKIAATLPPQNTRVNANPPLLSPARYIRFANLAPVV